MVQQIIVKFSAVPSNLNLDERSFMFWNGFLAHNINKNLNGNKYKLSERIVTCWNLNFL